MAKGQKLPKTSPAEIEKLIQSGVHYGPVELEVVEVPEVSAVVKSCGPCNCAATYKSRQSLVQKAHAIIAYITISLMPSRSKERHVRVKHATAASDIMTELSFVEPSSHGLVMRLESLPQCGYQFLNITIARLRSALIRFRHFVSFLRIQTSYPSMQMTSR